MLSTGLSCNVISSSAPLTTQWAYCNKLIPYSRKYWRSLNFYIHSASIIDVFSFIYMHGSILSSHDTKKMSWFGSLLGPLRSECCWSLFPPSSCLKCTKRSRIIPMYCMIISLSHIAQLCISLLIFIPESGHDSSYPYSNTFTSFHWPTVYMIW